MYSQNLTVDSGRLPQNIFHKDSSAHAHSRCVVICYSSGHKWPSVGLPVAPWLDQPTAKCALHSNKRHEGGGSCSWYVNSSVVIKYCTSKCNVWKTSMDGIYLKNHFKGISVLYVSSSALFWIWKLTKELIAVRCGSLCVKYCLFFIVVLNKVSLCGILPSTAE